MLRCVVIAALACFVGCSTTPQTLKASAIPADAPAGFVKLCREHPETAACQKVPP